MVNSSLVPVNFNEFAILKLVLHTKWTKWEIQWRIVTFRLKYAFSQRQTQVTWTISISWDLKTFKIDKLRFCLCWNLQAIDTRITATITAVSIVALIFDSFSLCLLWQKLGQVGECEKREKKKNIKITTSKNNG